MPRSRKFRGKGVRKKCARCGYNAMHRLRRNKKGVMIPESPCRRCSIHAHVQRKKKDPVRTKLRNTYDNMIARCHNPRARAYKDYGARGIAVCDAWRASFETFARDMGSPPTMKHTLERVFADDPYGPDTVRWATDAEQNRNRRNNRMVTAFGETKTVAEWAAERKLPYTTIQSRLNRHWAHEKAVSIPLSEGEAEAALTEMEEPAAVEAAVPEDNQVPF